MSSRCEASWEYMPNCPWCLQRQEAWPTFTVCFLVHFSSICWKIMKLSTGMLKNISQKVVSIYPGGGHHVNNAKETVRDLTDYCKWTSYTWHPWHQTREGFFFISRLWSTNRVCFEEHVILKIGKKKLHNNGQALKKLVRFFGRQHHHQTSSEYYSKY